MADKLIRGFYRNGDYHKYGDRLYTTTGNNTDGTMTQKAVTQELMLKELDINYANYIVVNSYINASAQWAAGDSNYNCIFVPVSAGQTFRLKAKSAAVIFYAFLTSNAHTTGTVSNFATGYTARAKVEKGSEVIVKAPSDATYLYFQTKHGGTDISPDAVELVSTLKESAEKVEVVKELPTVNTMVDLWINSSGKWATPTSSQKYAVIPVEPNTRYKILPKSGYYLTYTFLYDNANITNNANVHFAHGYSATVTSLYDKETIIISPDNAKYLAFLSSYNGSDRYPRKLEKIIEADDTLTKTIKVRLERVTLNGYTGGYGTGSYKNWFATSKMYRTTKDGVVKLTFFNASSTNGFRIFGYDENGKFCYVRNSIPQTKGTPVEVKLPDCKYFKVGIGLDAYSGTTDYPDIVEMVMEGAFPDDYEAYNTPQVTPDVNGNYMIALTLSIDAAVPAGQDIETATITDAVNIQFDNGMLALPSTYKADGTPTRLIIFCHGAGKHIIPGQSSWPTDAYGVDPTYWLSEGYAVLDMDGLPDDTTTAHCCVPLAYNSYVAAYRHVIANYNIYKDGVFLGGRSMGGAMSLAIMALGHIPVIACCPFAAMGVAPTRRFWGYTVKQKTMTAAACGIYNPDSVAWQQYDFPVELLTMEYATINGNQKYIGNFGRLMQFSPSYRLIVNNPSVAALTNEILFTSEETEELRNYLLQIYGDCIIKTSIPVKFFGAYDDTTVYPFYINLWVRMFRNGGNITEQRMFPSGGHAFDLANANRVQSFVNSRGNTMSNVPIAYIEALQFWRSYE